MPNFLLYTYLDLFLVSHPLEFLVEYFLNRIWLLIIFYIPAYETKAAAVSPIEIRILIVREITPFINKPAVSLPDGVFCKLAEDTFFTWFSVCFKLFNQFKGVASFISLEAIPVEYSQYR